MTDTTTQATGAKATAAKLPADPTKNKGKAGPTPKPVKETAKEIAPLKGTALSVEVGPAVLAILDTTGKAEAKARAALKDVEDKRYDALAMTTEAIIKAAKADTAIDLNMAFRDNPKGYKALTTQLYVALGLKEFLTMASGKSTVIYTKAAKSFFPTGKENKKSADYMRKKTISSNFSHMLKKCAQAAAGVIDIAATVKMDAKAGTLALSGPGVEKTFGKSEVNLDGKQREGLTAKPSFTELGRVAAVKRGAEVTTRKDSRTEVVTTDKAITSLSDSLRTALSKLTGQPSVELINALNAVQSAIAKVLSPIIKGQ